MTIDEEPTTVVQTTVQPATKSPLTIQPIPLNGLSSIAAPNTVAILFYEERLDDAALHSSFSHLLSAYPQLAGRLILASELGDDKPKDAPAYALRYNRTWVKYGAESDPGVPYTVVRRNESMTAYQPRHAQDGVADLAPLHGHALTPSYRGLLADRACSCATVQITHFTDGSTLAFGVSHMLADAQALGQMIADWASIHRSLLAGKVNVPSRSFDHVVVDGQATGDLNADAPDPALVELERQQSVFRYDAWASGVPVPEELKELDERQGRERGEPIPRTSGSRPGVSGKNYAVHFSADDVRRIHARISAQLEDTVSVHDAFAAHLWSLIARSRGLEGTLDLVMACDHRRRLPSPLPSALGCFNTCLGVQADADHLQGKGGEARAARRIRKAIESIRPDTIAAWLHRRAHDLDPLRERYAPCHYECTVMTTWARAGLENADFGAGRPVYTHFHVEAFPGYVVIMRECGDGEKWYEPGLHADVWLEEEAMRRLISDPDLRGRP